MFCEKIDMRRRGARLLLNVAAKLKTSLLQGCVQMYNLVKKSNESNVRPLLIVGVFRDTYFSGELRPEKNFCTGYREVFPRDFDTHFGQIHSDGPSRRNFPPHLPVSFLGTKFPNPYIFCVGSTACMQRVPSHIMQHVPVTPHILSYIRMKRTVFAIAVAYHTLTRR